MYLKTGGYPLIIYEYMIKEKRKSLDDKWYEEFTEIILEDIKYTNLRKEVAQELLQYMREINQMSPIVDLDKLENYIRNKIHFSKRELKRFRIGDYIEYFVNNFTMVKATEISAIRKYKTQNEAIRRIKLFVTDPFIFNAIYTKGSQNHFEMITRMLRDNFYIGKITEHTVCSHFLRLPNPILYYHIRDNSGEIDCICYYNRKYHVIEVKYTDNSKEIQAAASKLLSYLEDLNIKSRPIIVSKNILRFEKEYMIIPVYVFLLLF